jgi:hypothetical protein
VPIPVPPPGGFTAAELPALADTVLAHVELLDGEASIHPLEPVWHDEAVDLLRGAAPPGITAIHRAGIDLGASMPVADIAVIPCLPAQARSATSTGSQPGLRGFSILGSCGTSARTPVNSAPSAGS